MFNEKESPSTAISSSNKTSAKTSTKEISEYTCNTSRYSKYLTQIPQKAGNRENGRLEHSNKKARNKKENLDSVSDVYQTNFSNLCKSHATKEKINYSESEKKKLKQTSRNTMFKKLNFVEKDICKSSILKNLCNLSQRRKGSKNNKFIFSTFNNEYGKLNRNSIGFEFDSVSSNSEISSICQVSILDIEEPAITLSIVN